ncbi:uncharacterized protein UDID_19458 [Ustilago sp. UG-2017a]|nr:uncharacterized protein UDID_19458 [Ustilago sp. UG-2017a]
MASFTKNNCNPLVQLFSLFVCAHCASMHVQDLLCRPCDTVHHPHLSSSLRAYIDNCPTCLHTKLSCRVGELSIDHTLLADRLFHTLSVDFLLGLLECKSLDTALVVDMFSKLVLMAPCSSCITSAQLFNLLADLVLRKGWKLKVVITDSDKHFVGATGQQFAASIGVQLRLSAPYHQQANPVEHHIQTLQCVLCAFAAESAKYWVDILPAAKLVINSTPSLTTGQALFNLIYIVQPDSPVLPSVSDAKAEECLAITKARLDSVLDLPPNLYTNDLFNIFQLKPAPKEPDLFNHSLDAPITTDSQGITRFEVKAIVGQQCFRNYNQYCVKWRRDPCTTWEFEEDLLKDRWHTVIQNWYHKQGSTPAALAHALDSSLSEHLIAFISTTMSPADSKLLGLELEISCLAWAVHRFQHFLNSTIKITVLIDHAPLSTVLQSHSPSMRQFTPCIERLQAYLMPFLDSMEFVHKPGKQHSNVNTLSRISTENHH